MSETVEISEEKAAEIANQLEMLYVRTSESAYTRTAEDAAERAMELRERAGIERNPELINDD